MLRFDLGKKGGSRSKSIAGPSRLISAVAAAEVPGVSRAQGNGVLGQLEAEEKAPGASGGWMNKSQGATDRPFRSYCPATCITVVHDTHAAPCSPQTRNERF
ncbi:hypothetical protein KIL84_008344 [Mauremys mutica]|uniref:Uncharacterized protein n=1 Tax=Mauremys mutica TaxID=74926 RepID=A0A9D4B0C7_9SAUR|nr:hypothetical protein KIL84_008344 [Mauremys mutica]